LLIISAMIFASGGQNSGSVTASSGGIPDYINLDGYFPVVKQGTSVSMTVSWQPADARVKHSDPAQIWWFRFAREAFNIDLRVTPRAPGNEIKNLMFASGDLPDIWMSGISTNDVVNYGVSEKLILPITNYITPELMPNMYKVYSDDPELKSPSIASDGNVYGFSTIKGRNWLHGPITGDLDKSKCNHRCWNT